MEIGDLVIGSGNVGDESAWLNLSGTSSYTIENVIIEGNRFPYAEDFSANLSPVQNYNNIVLSLNLQFPCCF